MNNKRALITGITGQDGSYLADLLIDAGYEVHGIVRRSSSINTERIDHLYQDPHEQGCQFFLHYGDLADGSCLARILERVQPDEVYNLGAQSHVRVSFDTPEYTADVTGTGTARLLEAIRECQMRPRFYQASSSEMFGGLACPHGGYTEQHPFHPRSPYGCAKVYSHHLAVNYRESYGMHISCGILFNHESLTPSTPCLYRRDGIVGIAEIQDLVPHREDPKKGKRYTTEIRGLEVWDRDRWSKVTCATAHWEKDKGVCKVESRGGYYEATDDHVSFTSGGVECETAKLERGNLLELGRLPSCNGGVVISDEEAELLGMMMADGYYPDEHGNGHFSKRDKSLRERVKHLWRVVALGTTSDGYGASGFDKADVPRVNLNGSPLFVRLHRRELYDSRGKKRIPSRILNSPPNKQLIFLRAVNRCDGLKKGGGTSEFKSITTNSAAAAHGLWWLLGSLGLQATMNVERRDDRIYFHLNVRSPKKGKSGAHLIKDLREVKQNKRGYYTGWLFDLATETGTFSAGVGQTWVHNSPRRGETFVTRKIAKAAARISKGLQDTLFLGNLDSKRDWGFAGDYVKAMWSMLQQRKPDDYVIATGETWSVNDFLTEAFAVVGLDPLDYVRFDPRYVRPAEVDVLLGNPTKAREKLGWEPTVGFKSLVRMMVDSELSKL